MTRTAIRARALTRRDWPIVEELFGAKGACAGCWCMFWRAERGGKDWEAQKGAGNRRRFKKLIEAGRAQGCLAFAGKEPIGWCSTGPKSDYPYFERSRNFEASDDPQVWCVTCFFIRRDWRGSGVATALLEAAVALAQRRRATIVEGYPIKPRNKTMPDAFAWTGIPALFKGVGFVSTRKPPTRPVYVKKL